MVTAVRTRAALPGLQQPELRRAAGAWGCGGRGGGRVAALLCQGRPDGVSQLPPSREKQRMLVPPTRRGGGQEVASVPEGVFWKVCSSLL